MGLQFWNKTTWFNLVLPSSITFQENQTFQSFQRVVELPIADRIHLLST